MEGQNEIPETKPVIIAIGNDATLTYLLGRFAERSGHQLMVSTEGISGSEAAVLDAVAIIFLSLEQFAGSQSSLIELASLDTPIMVCSSASEEAQAIELGADYCLLHPLTYDDFQATLAYATASKHV